MIKIDKDSVEIKKLLSTFYIYIKAFYGFDAKNPGRKTKLQKLSEQFIGTPYGDMVSYFKDHLEEIIKCDPTKLKDQHNKMLIAVSYDPTNLTHREDFDKFKKTMQNYYAAFFQQRIDEKGEQISIGRWLTRSLKMDVCPYCNHNYTITVNDRKKKIVVKPDFDHFYSKSIHPILALSFFNLVPICSTCNKLKGEKEVTQNPYDNSHPLPKFKLYGKDKSGNLVLFGLGDAFDEIEIFPEAEYSNLDLKACNIEKLGLKQIYDQHIDYVTEIVDNIQQYNIGRYSDESTPPFRCKVHHFFYDKKGVSQSIPLTGDSVNQT